MDRARMSEFEIKNLIAMRLALDHHNDRCPVPAEAFLLNPIDHGLFGFETLWGLPVLVDEDVAVKRAQIACSGSAERIEAELTEHIAANEGDASAEAA